MAETQLTLFDLPTDPEEIGVLLPPARLRRVNFSALDFDTARRAIIEYIQAYYPNDFNDFVASNGVMMWMEIQASNTAKLALRSDLLANEAFLPTARTEEAVQNHLTLINQTIRAQTPAVVDIECSVSLPLTTDLEIQPGTQFTFRGPDGESVTYEIYRAPGDFTGKIVVPAGKRGIIAYGIEGEFAAPFEVSSPGGPNQKYIVDSASVLSEPVQVKIDTGAEIQTWLATMEPLENSGGNDQVMNYAIFANRVEFSFGDDQQGKAPLAGQQITINYRTGGGVRGRIGSGTINETRSISPLPPASSPVQVLFRNLVPSSGGTDRETIEQAKKRAPRDFMVRAFASDRPASIVTDDDYIQVASTFAHPTFGAVAKAAATVRTGRNINLVEVYVLTEGPDALTTPNSGLKQALKNYLDEYNVLTDSVEVLDGVIKSVNIDMTVVINRNADATFVKDNVNVALDDLLSTSNRDMGQPLYVSDIIEVVSNVDGVAYVDLFTPADNILPTNALAVSGSTGVGINEIIVEGNREVRFFYERIDTK